MQGLVSHDPSTSGSLPHAVATEVRSTAQQGGTPTPQLGPPKLNRMDGLWGHLEAAGVPAAAAGTIEASLGVLTRSLYKRKWDAFKSWCDTQGTDSFQPAIGLVLEYLQGLKEYGLK